jgi:hypothetical protein
MSRSCATPNLLERIAAVLLAPTAHIIPAWGEAPCVPGREVRGLKARPIPHVVLIPEVAFVAFDSIFFEECTKFILKGLLSVMRFLHVDVVDQSLQVGRSNGERAIASLPREFGQSRGLGLEPFRRGGLELFHQFGRADCAGQANGQMNVVRRTSCPIALHWAFRATVAR